MHKPCGNNCKLVGVPCLIAVHMASANQTAVGQCHVTGTELVRWWAVCTALSGEPNDRLMRARSIDEVVCVRCRRQNQRLVASKQTYKC